MLHLLVLLRAAQLATHSFHHLCARSPFHSDHEFFGDSYGAFEAAYDSVAERIVGLKGEEPLALGPIMAQVCQKLQGVPSVGVKENKVFYMAQLRMEQELCMLVSQECAQPGTSEGTKQMLGDLCDKSEVRQYKIKQRIKG